MSYIPEEVIQDIRQKTDIVDVINQYVQLTKKGNNFTASCPFHEDRNPSFSVHPGKQIYKCFSCGRGGNVYGFLQEIEGIGFVQAVQKAAEFSNVALDERYLTDKNAEHKKENQTLYDIHKKVNDFYHYYLLNTTNGEDALNYLTNRDMTNDTMTTFQLGLAPLNSEVLLQYLSQENFSHEDLLASGIFYESSQGKLIDRFRGRIIFPLRNSRGEVVAFSGRVYDENLVSQANAKYLNSPETEIFHKTNLVYNLDIARPRIRQLNQVLVCEGYMDVIGLHQAGYQHAVATMGTSLTEAHIKQLGKLANEIIFVFDGDDAGQKATARAFDISSKYKQLFKSIQIPNRLDPDEWIKQKGAASFQTLINQADSRFEFYRMYLKQEYDVSDDQQLAAYIERLIELIAEIASPIEQQLRIQDIVEQYHLNESILYEQLARARQTSSSSTTQEVIPVNYEHEPVMDEEWGAPPPEDLSEIDFSHVEVESVITPTVHKVRSIRAFQSEKHLLACLMYYQESWDYIAQTNQAIIMFHETAQAVYFELQEYYYQGNKMPLTGIVDKIQDTEINHFLTTLIWESDPLGYSDEIINDCLRVINEEFILLEIKELKQKSEQYRKEQKFTENNEVINRIMSLNRQLKKR